jgi:hypothetical protein
MHRLWALAFALLISVGASGANHASADGVRFGDGIHGRGPVVGFIGCDMHAPDGPVVELFQIARNHARLEAERLRGMPCADALVMLQKRGLRLGQSRVIPGSATTDPDCLLWDIVGPE